MYIMNISEMLKHVHKYWYIRTTVFSFPDQKHLSPSQINSINVFFSEFGNKRFDHKSNIN